MSKPNLFIAYYTKNTPYYYEAQKLKQCLEDFNLPHEIVAIDNLGSWQKNTHYKAKFIQDAMKRHPEISLIYLDADAIIHQRPCLFDELACDIAVCYYDNPHLKKRELINGTIYFANTPIAKKIVDDWIAINQAHPEVIEQQNFEKAIENSRSHLSLIELPASYTMIYDLMAHLGPPVIEHFQASRRYRKRIDKSS